MDQKQDLFMAQLGLWIRRWLYWFLSAQFLGPKRSILIWSSPSPLEAWAAPLVLRVLVPESHEKFTLEHSANKSFCPQCTGVYFLTGNRSTQLIMYVSLFALAARKFITKFIA